MPNGLTINPVTGEISGTPTVLSASTIYTVTATNSGGTDTTTITLAVNDAAPSISYPVSYLFTKGQTIPIIYATNSGGTATSWEVSDLPAGLAIDPVAGFIWGSPTTVTPMSTYTVWANNSGGSSSTSITITVNDVLPDSFAYSPTDMLLTINQAMTPNTVSPGGGVVTSWEISPDVPSGLNFGSSNGTIWGTPTVLQVNSITYTVWANNSGGSTSTSVTITINNILPIVSYAENDLILTKGSVMNVISPTNSGGAAYSWSISPSIPNGLSFDSITGEISGTPTSIQIRTIYLITATNSGGASNAYLNITINDIVPSISYSQNEIVATIGVPISPHSIPTNSGGVVTDWEIFPNPGPHFHFNDATVSYTHLTLPTIE